MFNEGILRLEIVLKFRRTVPTDNFFSFIFPFLLSLDNKLEDFRIFQFKGFEEISSTIEADHELFNCLSIPWVFRKVINL